MELSVSGAGTTKPVEDSTKEMVFMHLRSKAKAKAKERAKETVIIADRPGISPENAPTRKRARVKEKVSKESVITAARRVIPQGSAPKAKMEGSRREKEIATNETARHR